MKREKAVSILSLVKQIIETNDIDTANVMLQSQKWILLNVYYNTSFTTKKPLCIRKDGQLFITGGERNDFFTEVKKGYAGFRNQSTTGSSSNRKM